MGSGSGVPGGGSLLPRIGPGSHFSGVPEKSTYRLSVKVGIGNRGTE